MLNGKYDWVPLADEHLETILKWRNDENVRRNMYTTHLITLAEQRVAELDNWRGTLAPGSSARGSSLHISPLGAACRVQPTARRSLPLAVHA